MSETTPPVSGLLGWFATNPVAAYLLMIFIIPVDNRNRYPPDAGLEAVRQRFF